MQTPSKSYLLKSINACGLPTSIVGRVLPSWWDDELFKTNSGMMQFCLLMKNRLGVDAKFLDDGKLQFTRRKIAVEFKKNINMETSSLSNATSFANGVASTFVRMMQFNDRICSKTDGLEDKLFNEKVLSLSSAIQILWAHNIPTLYVDNYPQQVSRPAGLVMEINGFFCIVLSHRKRSPAAQLFILLHEVGHIIRKHLNEGQIIADVTASELGESLREDNDEQETEADDFALNILRHGRDIKDFFENLPRRPSAAELVAAAIRYAKETEVQIGHLILSYGRLNNEWPTAMNALKFIERENAQDMIKDKFIHEIEKMSYRVDDLEFIKKAQGIKIENG